MILDKYNIFVSNTNSDYDFIIKKIFNMYNIPININNTSTLYQTEIVSLLSYYLNQFFIFVNKPSCFCVVDTFVLITSPSAYNIFLKCIFIYLKT